MLSDYSQESNISPDDLFDAVNSTSQQQAGPPDWQGISLIGQQPSYSQGMEVVTSGFTVLDKALGGGFRRESCYTLAGRTGAAKSTLAANIARRAALVGNSTLLFKLEEAPYEAVWRMHAATARIPLNRFLDGTATASTSDRRHIDDAWSVLSQLPIRLSDVRNINSIGRAIESHVEAAGKLVIIDQLSMVETGAQTPYERISLASDNLRTFAQRYRVPILVVCQISRTASRDDKPLGMNDLRDSGVIENNSAGVLLINKAREVYESKMPGSEPFKLLDILIGKNRYGRITPPDQPLELSWWPREARIEDERPVWARGAA